TLGASLMPGLAQGAALDSIDAVAKQMLPPGTTTALAGESREYKESGSAIYFAFVIALIVVFMVLASQFESLLHPLTVLTAVPVAWGIGAGSAARKPLGYAIVGGVFFSTALTLFVVPAAYLVIPSVLHWLRSVPGRLYRLVVRSRQPVTAEGD